MGIIKSEKRVLESVNLEIAEGIILTATGAINIHVPLIVNHVDFFPSSFKLKIEDIVIYIDPVIVEDNELADIILITHSHQDHFSLPDIKRLVKKETIIICPKSVNKKLMKKISSCSIIETKPGDKIDYKDIAIESIGAYNVKSKLLTPHPKSAMNVGYIVNSGDIRIYHTGDTDYTPEMNQIKNVTVVLTPIDGGNLTMTTEKAAEFINDLKPKFVIPMHYNLGTDEIEKFKKLINSDTKVIIMDK